MFFTGRNNPILQRTEKSRTHFRGSRALAGAVSSLALILAGCSDSTETADGSETNVALEQSDARISLAFPASQLSDDLVFLASEDSPWTGLIASSTREGGLEIFNVDGQLLAQAAGPRMTSLAGAPAFALRGAVIPLIFGIDLDGALRAQAFLRPTGETLEIALSAAELQSGIAAVCHYESGIGFEDLAVITQNDTVQIWRIQDIGEESLSAEMQSETPLPFPTRGCASADSDLVLIGPSAGLARFSLEGETLAEAPGFAARDIVATELLGRKVVLATVSGSSALVVFDALTLEPISEVAMSAGLNTPAVITPGAIALTEDNYGGMGFANGIVTIFDRDDNRIKLVSRDTLARAVIQPDA